MTLVLAYANPDFVIIAADRRTTTGGSPTDDAFTKTAVIYNRYLVGFTGLAELGPGKQTMEWFVKTAAKFPTCFDVSGIADEATKAVNKIRADRESKRLAFAAVGYDHEGKITYILISNMHSDETLLPDGRRQVEVLPGARDKFTYIIDNPPVRSTIRCVGWPMPNEAGSNMLQRLETSHGEKLPSINRVQDILAGAIEASAGEYISSTALITILQKDGSAQFDVVTPSSKAGQTVDIASPYVLFPGGSIIVMPNQRLRKAKPAK